jgi:hypothetical protein
MNESSEPASESPIVKPALTPEQPQDVNASPAGPGPVNLPATVDTSDPVSVLVVGDYQQDTLWFVQAAPRDSLPENSTARRGAVLKPLTMLSGADFMARFIASALSEIDGLNAKIRSFGVEVVLRNSDAEPVDEGSSSTPEPVKDKHVVHWNLEYSPGVERGDAQRLRLRTPLPEAWETEPEIPTFPQIGTSTPDIVAINDLGVFFSKATAVDNSFKQGWESLLAGLRDRAESDQAHLSGRRDGWPFPIIVAAVSADMAVATEPDYWTELADAEELCDRTIVVLDADKLRDAGLNISTSLSWERTAQSFVAEFNSHPLLQRFRAFRHLIVRFGVTGAIHCWRKGSQHHHRLYYDPSRDDGALSVPHDGVVIGYNSVFIGSVAQAVVRTYRTCDPLHDCDLDQAIGQAVRWSVRRCGILYEVGYGKDIEEAAALRQEFYVPDQLFEDLDDHSFITQLTPREVIGDVAIPSHRSDNWTILEETSAFRLQELARRIVLRGISGAFNQPEWDIRQAYYRQLVDKLRAHADAKMALSIVKKSRSDRITVDGCIAAIEETENALKSPLAMPWKRQVQATRRRDQLLKKFSESAKSVCDKLAKGSPQREDAEERKRVDVVKFADSVRRLLRNHPKDFLLDEYLEKPIVVPVAQFDKLTLIDRHEIEGLRTVRNLIQRHLESTRQSGKKRPTRPLSIATFGPPGSGKSFGVENVIRSLGAQGQEIKFWRTNLGQLSSVSELDDAFDDIVASVARKDITIAFFDEFDAKLGHDDLGWLKYFLPPMEDGEYKGRPVADAIFVFAGGTSSTFRDFSRDNESTTDEQRARFSAAKGPDFVSRCASHIDIHGVNPRSAGDEGYVVRRAILLRHFVERLQGLGSTDTARIDEDLLHAFLFVSKYRHGGRSMRLLLDLCASQTGQIVKSTLPTLAQLSMYVDGQSFMYALSHGSR